MELHNISHSNDFIVLVFGSNTLGVDVEFVKEEDLKDIFTANEVDLFKNLVGQDKNKFFYKIWYILPLMAIPSDATS